MASYELAIVVYEVAISNWAHREGLALFATLGEATAFREEYIRRRNIFTDKLGGERFDSADVLVTKRPVSTLKEAIKAIRVIGNEDWGEFITVDIGGDYADRPDALSFD